MLKDDGLVADCNHARAAPYITGTGLSTIRVSPITVRGVMKISSSIGCAADIRDGMPRLDRGGQTLKNLQHLQADAVA
jgi:hypothetical protein